MYTKPSTSPKRQYIFTAVFAILAIVSALSVTTSLKEGNPTKLNAVTMSYTEKDTENEHNTSLESLALDEYEEYAASKK